MNDLFFTSYFLVKLKKDSKSLVHDEKKNGVTYVSTYDFALHPTQFPCEASR